MSQRSRRFLASREGAKLPSLLDHPAHPAATDLATMVPTMRSAIAGGFDAHAALATPRQGKAETPADGHLDQTRQHVGEVAAKVVEWAKQHPVRMAGAAAALVAVSGFLLRLVHGKAAKVAGIAKAARSAKAGVKARVKRAVKAMAAGKPRAKRARLATA